MARLFSFLLAFALFTAGLSAQNSVAGSWELSINGPEGPITATADLKQDGEKVTGSITSPQGSTELSGTFSGNTLSLAFQVQSPQGAHCAGSSPARRSTTSISCETATP